MESGSVTGRAESEDPLASARVAARRHAWADAYGSFLLARQRGDLGAEDLETFAQAGWWSGHLRESEEALERAFAAYLAEGKPRRAAMVAFDIWRAYQHKLKSPIATGWFRRAERLLANEPEAAEHAHLELAHAFVSQNRGDLETALDQARRALDIATRHGDAEAQALALNRQGRILIKQGKVDDGMALIDEAMVAAVSGELGPLPTAIVYCSTIVACEDLADYGRAGEWTDAARRWCERKSISGFPGICRVHRAEVMRLRGAWHDAEQEARRACKELQDYDMLDAAGEALYEIGEIRLRMGDLDEAADLFYQAHSMGRDPQPGLSVLQLRRGKTQAALASIRRALAERHDRLARAKILPAVVEIAVAAGDVGEARSGTDDLEAIAEAYGSPALRAAAQTARGAVQMTEGDPGAACASLRSAARSWQGIDLPYEAARARLMLSEAYRAAGDPEAAATEREAARLAFQRLGADGDARRLSEPLRIAAAPTDATMAVTALPDTGEVLLDKFEILSKVGQGGMGVVLEARNVRTGRHVAVKFLRAGPCVDPSACQRLLREALACGRVQHPNVVDVYDAGLREETPYVVMELLRGESLASRIEREGRLPVGDACRLALQALAGLGAAHAAGIVHRDIKPDNLFLARPASGGEPTVKIVDFGISKIESSEPSPDATQTGTVLGTPHYMSPEQIRGSRDLDGRTDLYSLGAVLYRALTGREPFQAESLPALAMSIVSDPAPAPRGVRPEIGPRVEAVIVRAIDKERDRRYQNADEFSADLAAALAAEDL